MQKNRAALFLIQFLSYLWYFTFFLVVVPWLMINVGQALDFLLFNYFLKIDAQGWELLLPFAAPLLDILGALFLIFGLGLLWQANQVLIQHGASFPLSIIGHRDLTPQKLAAVGPYSRLRHPMLLGYLLILAALAIFVKTPLGLFWVIPLLASLMLEYLFLTEEKHLLTWFGEEYQKYRAQTPSLLPKWR